VEPFAAAVDAAATLARLTGRDVHDVAVVLGSGWAPAAAAIGAGEAVDVPVSEISGFPAPSVAGHSGVVRSVEAEGRPVLIFLGRVHLYEGHSPATVVHGVRTAIAAGCRYVILTNAAGAVNVAYGVGQPVLIRDHLNLTATSPLVGPPPPPVYPPRFVDLTDLYSARLRQVAREQDATLEEGVYAALIGPNYETPAEVAMLRHLGADLVGMSTALEAIAARHLGAEVLGISLVTNVAAGHDVAIHHEEVIAAGAAAADAVGSLLAAVIRRLP
jgi:purine-nucleoside phosphorylase